jgi:hypothetical protein
MGDMKRAFQILVLMVASLVAVQPLLVQEACVPGACPTDRCATGCCADMDGMGAQAMSAGCHGAQSMTAMNSTESQHRCEMNASRTTTQLVTTEKFKVTVGSQAAPLMAVTVEPVQAATALPLWIGTATEPDRYLLLHTFRI